MIKDPMIRLIDELGAELGVQKEARKKWRQRGVSYRWRLPILELAKERGITLSSSDFETGPSSVQ